MCGKNCLTLLSIPSECVMSISLRVCAIPALYFRLISVNLCFCINSCGVYRMTTFLRYFTIRFIANVSNIFGNYASNKIIKITDENVNNCYVAILN